MNPYSDEELAEIEKTPVPTDEQIDEFLNHALPALRREAIKKALQSESRFLDTIAARDEKIELLKQEIEHLKDKSPF